MDLDSILWIVISLVILIVSGVSSARRRKAQEQQGAGGETDREFDPYSTESSPAAEPADDPFTRLEQFLSGESGSGGFREDETRPAQREQPTEGVSQETTEPRIISLEGESLETIVDEEEALLEEQRASRPAIKETIKETTIGEDDAEISDDLSMDHDMIAGLTGLFANPGEIRRAVIYSEIFRRKF